MLSTKTLKKILCVFPIFPSTAKSIGDIMDGILFSMFVTCTVIIAFNLHVLGSNELFSLQTVVAICDVACLLPSSFTYCYQAEIVTANLLKIGDIVYGSAWYRLPVKQQQRLIFPLQRSQHIYRLKSLRLINCSLPVFWTVCGYLSKLR